MLHAYTHIFKGGFRYLAAKSEADHYLRELKREQEEIIAVPDIGLHIAKHDHFHQKLIIN
jgi:hypothetical protein